MLASTNSTAWKKKGIEIYDIASLHNNITLNTEGVSSENRKLQVHSAMQPPVAKGFYIFLTTFWQLLF